MPGEGYLGSDVMRTAEQILQATRDIVLFVRRDGHIIEANDAAVRVYGRNREDLVSMTIYDLSPMSTVQTVNQQMEAAAKSGIVFETRHCRNDGSEFPVEVSVYTQNIAGEQMLLSIVRDLTERKLAEDHLQASEQRLRFLMDNTADIIWTTDATGKYTFVTPSIERVLGYTVEESMKHGLIQINTPDSLQKAANKLSEVISKVLSGQRVTPETFELKNFHKDGTAIWVEITLNGMYDNKGAFMGVVGITRDITARKSAEEAKEKLVLELQRTLAELKTLQGIIPICSSCKKIRDDKGCWHQIEAYVRDHTQADFSHGLCPHCMEKIYPDIWNENEDNTMT